MPLHIRLREVADADLPILFEHQRDPEANQMAAFTAREREPFMAHWARIRAEAAVTVRTILCDEQVAGNIVCFEESGKQAVGYWLGKDYWGRGIATQALTAFLKLVPQRPLYAFVAKHNVGSRRVLEKCGFALEVEEAEGFLLKLDRRPTTDHLLARLNAIGETLAQTGHALALIGLGSVGVELERLDDYSDLDFFVVVEPSHKAAFIQSLDWLSRLCPIAYAFRNSADGYKLLFEDGVFCEFAVFEEAELHHIPFAPGRLIWKKPGVSDAVGQPPAARPNPEPPAVEWLLGEALTNLYVGLGRYRRGEKLSAMRFIQGYAVDRMLELSEHLEPATASPRDIFARERRYEQRHPQLAQALPNFTQGYERSPESARALLIFLERHFEIQPALKRAILALCNDP